MGNLADLLTAQLATPARVLYRRFVDGAWSEFSAADVAQRAARSSRRSRGRSRTDRSRSGASRC